MDCQAEENLGRLIYYTARDIQNLAEKILRPYALSLEQFIPLKALVLCGPMSQRRLCEEVGKTPANMTRLIDRLERKALVERRPDPDDRRAVRVVITECGQQLVEQVTGIFESYSAGLLAGIAPADEELVKRVLKKIAGNVQRMAVAIEKESAR